MSAPERTHAHNGQELWAGFRRATIAAALILLVVAVLAGQLAPYVAEVMIYGVAIGWAVYVALFTAPGVVRLLRRRLHR